MPIVEHLFEEIEMNYIVELPESDVFNAIVVVIVRLTKVQYYIPAKTTWTAEDVANSYINDIWKLYSLLRHMTSDRGPQFASELLKQRN